MPLNSKPAQRMSSVIIWSSASTSDFATSSHKRRPLLTKPDTHLGNSCFPSHRALCGSRFPFGRPRRWRRQYLRGPAATHRGVCKNPSKKKRRRGNRRRFAFGPTDPGYFSRMISTRRLACSLTPSGVTTAWSASPRPPTVILSPMMSLVPSRSRTASARFSDRPML